jgi:hypothetical protein
MLSAANRAEVDSQGWSVIPGVIDEGVAARARALIDGVLGTGICERVPLQDSTRWQDGDGQAWPDPGSTLPIVLSADWRHSILHPICDPLMAELTVPFRAAKSRDPGVPRDRGRPFTPP